MIFLVNGSEKEQYSYYINTMHRIRAEVFHERLQWEVNVKNGLEIDRFDEFNPLYLLSIDEETGRIRGSARLLPTTGPNMLRDVFPTLLPDNEVVESALIWESSRFSMEPGAETPLPGQLVSQVTAELIAGICEVGLIAGLTDVVSVFDARMVRIMRASGSPATIIGRPHRIGAFMTYAGLFEVSEAALANIRSATGLEGSVLERQSVTRCLAA
ncbi:MAG: hypothetical protein EBU34_03130 [Alphaproteobacteria bacterium]|jgi:acyl homoserine lactone synthase|nr:hypothetical protein [Beijerinckiaceae bacterium]NBQ38776.1 hypothetical protein [Alphaproteobacteria bacterium]